MRRSARSRLVTLACALALLAGFSGAAPSSPAAADAGYTERQVDVPAHDGVVLKGLLFESTAPGEHPLVLMPSTWLLPREEYVLPARKLAAQGYSVLVFHSRGWHSSGGTVDAAGPDTIRDMSDAVNWAARNTGAVTDRVGCAGLSYTGAICLLAAAEEPRIRAVHSFSGWADFASSAYTNDTRSRAGAWMMVTMTRITGRPGPFLVDLEKQMNDDTMDRLRPQLDQRGAINRVDKLNANRPAVMISHGYQDSLFPPNQMIDLAERLTTDTYVWMAAGDHGSIGLLGMLGFEDRAYTDTLLLFDRYLKGKDNGLSSRPKYEFTTSDPSRTKITAATAAGLEPNRVRRYLSRPVGSWFTPAVGGIGNKPASGWTTSVDGAKGTLADTFPFSDGTQNAASDWRPTVALGAIDRSGAAVFVTSPFKDGATLAGTPRVGFSLASTTGDASVFAYLYEVDPSGNAGLITEKPFSIRGQAPGQAHEIAFDLDATAWKIKPGNRFGLILDTADMRFDTRSAPGSKVTFGSSAGSPAFVDLPLR